MFSSFSGTNRLIYWLSAIKPCFRRHQKSRTDTILIVDHRCYWPGPVPNRRVMDRTWAPGFWPGTVYRCSVLVEKKQHKKIWLGFAILESRLIFACKPIVCNKKKKQNRWWTTDHCTVVDRFRLSIRPPSCIDPHCTFKFFSFVFRAFFYLFFYTKRRPPTDFART